jgi:predicted regulator of Ras-like GTPase activity (Roadblock/LC7/MglB family)
MGSLDLSLHGDDYMRLRGLIDGLRRDASARLVFLLDRNGQPIANCGELGETDPTALASLAAGNVAATEGLAQLIGEKTFASLYHEGERDSLHMTAVGGRMILVVVFDERSSLGLVRLRVRLATPAHSEVVEQVETRSAANSEMDVDFSDISDSDITALLEGREMARS